MVPLSTGVAYVDGIGGTALGTACPTAPAFTASEGPCTVDSTGTCFRSPNFPSDYDNNQACTITALEAMTLSVTEFETEYYSDCTYDFLTVNDNNHRAQALYKALGYSAASTRKPCTTLLLSAPAAPRAARTARRPN